MVRVFLALVLVCVSLSARGAETLPAGPPERAAQPSTLETERPDTAPANAATGDSIDALTQAARLQDSLGGYEEAEAAYRKVLALQKASNSVDTAVIGDTLMNLAIEVSNQGRFAEAADLFKAAEPLLQTSVDPIDDARLVSYLALDAANRHSFAEARDLARRATEERRALASKGDDSAAAALEQHTGRTMVNGYLARGEMVQSRLLEASMSLRLGDLGAASEAAGEALEITQSTPGIPDWWQAEAMGQMGEIEGDLGHVTDGETLLRGSIDRFQRLFGDARPTALAWMALGRFHAQQGRYADAVPDFRQGLLILTRVRRDAGLLSFDTIAPYFTALIGLAENRADQREQLLGELFVALQAVQKSRESDMSGKSFLRLAASNQQVAVLLRDLQDSERARDEMRLALANETAKPAEARDAERERWLVEQYRSTSARAERLDEGLKKNVPEYRRLNHLELVSLTDLQKTLQTGEVFVTYAFGESFGLVFAVTATSAEAKVLPFSANRISSEIQELREGIIVRGGRVQRYDLSLAYELYRQLLLPVQPSLAAADHLILAASGALASLPLDALVTKVPQSDRLGEAAWLIRRMAISQMPFAASFMALRQHVMASHAPRAFLGVGNPLFTGVEGGLTAALSRCGDGLPISPDILSQLPALPDTATEVRNVAAALGAGAGDVLLGGAATEAGLRAKPLDQYRILYFATHGLLPAELRCQSEPALALSPPSVPATSKAEDGLLEASEIAGLKLDADLVVLSACNTATAGGKLGGETLASLSDMFFYAGSRGVLATHWSVPSASTTKLMTFLFKAYAANPTKGFADALRRAQLSLLDDPQTAHPVHWAAFSLIGGLDGDSRVAGATP